MDLDLGIDVGTSRIKVVALAPDGARRVARAPTPVGTDGTGPVHEPAAVMAVVESLARTVVSSLPGGRVRAVATASVSEEGVALGGDGQPLYPSLAWYARRHSATADRFSATHPASATYAVCGLPQDPIQTIFQWAWLNDHAPSVLRDMATWLSLSGYVAYALSGGRAMEPSQACRTHLWSPFEAAWQDEWVRAVGGEPSALPPVRPAGSVLAPLRSDALPGVARRRDAVVAVGGHDHAVGAWAAGVRAPGLVLDSLGTAETLYAVSLPGARPTEAGRQACLQHGRAVSVGPGGGSYVLAALHSGAGLAALARLVGAPLDTVALEAEAVPPGARGMRFDAPLWGDDPRGRLRRVPLEVTRGELARAMLEGWGRAAAVALDAVARESGAAPAAVRAIGGGARLDLAMRVRASMLACPLEVVEEPELVALGAALLARSAVKPSLPAPPLVVRSVKPVAAWAQAYAAMGEDRDGL